MKPIKLIVADDHLLFRESLISLLYNQNNIIIVGSASNGEELVTKITTSDVDVAITDIQMPVLDGIQAAKQIKRLKPSVAVIALSSFNDNFLVTEMMNSGAKGYLTKTVGLEELMRAIATVHNGGVHYAQDSFNHSSISTKQMPSNDVPTQSFGLTRQEIKIIKLICGELTTKEIASQLFISQRSVETHRTNIFRKLQIRNVVGLAMFATRFGLVTA